MYTMVVRPMVTYAATVWWQTVRLRISRAERSKLQRMTYLGITGAIEVLIEVPQLHLPLEAEARTGIYRLYCSDRWKPKSEDFGHIHDSGHERGI
jgi:hypothetical protein